MLWSDEKEPTNLGNPMEMSIMDFAVKIKELSGSDSPIEERPLPTDDPKVRQPDITKAKKVLGWQPQVPLETGLTNAIAYFREKLGEN